MRLRPLILILSAALLSGAGLSRAQTASPTGAGQLLYDTHCSTCHDQQVHWRGKTLVRDWESLRAQVRRWQDTARLGWRQEEIDQVARHLNDTIYRFPNTGLARRD